jgi:hypothetical protein
MVAFMGNQEGQRRDSPREKANGGQASLRAKGGQKANGGQAGLSARGGQKANGGQGNHHISPWGGGPRLAQTGPPQKIISPALYIPPHFRHRPSPIIHKQGESLSLESPMAGPATAPVMGQPGVTPVMGQPRGRTPVMGPVESPDTLHPGVPLTKPCRPASPIGSRQEPAERY